MVDVIFQNPRLHLSWFLFHTSILSFLCSLYHKSKETPCGWWFQPLWKIFVSQLGWWNSQYIIYGKIKKCSSHHQSTMYRLAPRKTSPVSILPHLLQPPVGCYPTWCLWPVAPSDLGWPCPGLPAAGGSSPRSERSESEALEVEPGGRTWVLEVRIHTWWSIPLSK